MTSSSSSRIILGTRGSVLALKQAESVAQELKRRITGLCPVIRKISTRGDEIRDVPLTAVDGKGFFTKEIEQALLMGDIDVAVHSAKDLPARVPEGLRLAAITERLDPRDVLISPLATDLKDLPEGSRIGTSSLRRKAQVLAAFPGLRVIPMRGNLDTRIKKLHRGEAEAIVVARAGLLRMGIAHSAAQIIPYPFMLPAAGQGALALETREGDDSTNGFVSRLNDDESFHCIQAERHFLLRLRGGCQVPVGVVARVSDAGFAIEAVVARPDGTNTIRAGLTGDCSQRLEIAEKLAKELVDQGASRILEELGRGLS